mmetsp:Transcript_37045/g.83848  ORF Transcript_37045/g.83848 Transcript_37045/m.83848 type:complete len:303 (+) Transcript_37045:592-1500(+)
MPTMPQPSAVMQPASAGEASVPPTQWAAVNSFGQNVPPAHPMAQPSPPLYSPPQHPGREPRSFAWGQEYPLPPYRYVVREWCGQPYVFTVPVLRGPIAPSNCGPWAESVPGSTGGVAAAAGGVGVVAEQPARPPVDIGPADAARDEAAGEGNVDAVKLLLKLVLFVYILGQDGGPNRTFLLSIGAVIVFLGQVGYLDFIPRLVAPAPRPQVPPAGQAAPTHAVGDAANVADPAGDGADPALAGDSSEQAVEGDEEARQPPPARSVWRELEGVVVAFFTSLFPSLPTGDPGEQAAVAAGPGAM